MATLNQLKSDLQQSELFKDVADVLSASSSFAYKDIFDNYQNDLIESKFFLDKIADITNSGAFLFPVISLDLKEGIWGYPKGSGQSISQDEAEKIKPVNIEDSLVIAIGSNSGFCSNYNKDIMNGFEMIKKENCKNEPKLITIGKQIRKINKTDDDAFIPEFPETKKAKDHAKNYPKLSYVKPPTDIPDKDKANAVKDKRIQKLGFIQNLPLKKDNNEHYEYIILLFTDRYSKDIHTLEDFLKKAPRDATEKKPLNTEARPYAYFFKNGLTNFEYDFNQVFIPNKIIIEPNIDAETHKDSQQRVKDTLYKIWYRVIKSYLFYALFTSEMSENEARMKAMTQASDNIKENIDLLKRQFQRKRQELITKELIEIISGAEALKRAKGGK